MSDPKSTLKRGSSSCARVVPLNIETAKQLGGGARGRTLALIYRQLSYWSKYAKWRGSRNRKFFYKSQKELAEELGYSEKTIYRAIKALRELGLVVVEKLHKRYWRQVYFYYLPHSPYAAADAAPEAAQAAPAPAAAPANDSESSSSSTTTNPSSRSAVNPLAAAAAQARSIRSRGQGGFGQNVRIQHKKNNPLIKQSLQAIVERCNAIGETMKNGREGVSIDAALASAL